ncbi:MAG: AzlD domain-containing protein [Acidimicrobiales bacterium]
MSSITALALVLVVGAITYAMRAGLILALADREIPTIVTRALRNVAPAVLSTLVISLIANPDAPNVGISLPEVAGVVVAGPSPGTRRTCSSRWPPAWWSSGSCSP